MSSLKIGTLLIRTVAKPIALRIKSYSKTHPKFKSACISMAQAMHRFELNLKMKFLGYKKETIRPLNDARAIEAGTNFLSEAFLFSVAAGVIYFEATRTKRIGQAKQQAIEDRLVLLRQGIDDLQLALEEERERNVLLLVEMEGLRKNGENVQRVLERVLHSQLKDALVIEEHSPSSEGGSLFHRLGVKLGRHLPHSESNAVALLPTETPIEPVPTNKTATENAPVAAIPVTVVVQERPGLRDSKPPS
ncbi:optic atrophy 3 protein-domain-containing protein [Syncephalis fuscata]|nr:optic atrophy 3 protein-domain-containing protein [Syncephalis fuscata]